MQSTKDFLLSDSGTSTTEYAIMLSLIVLVAIGAITGVGTKVESAFTALDNGVSGVM